MTAAPDSLSLHDHALAGDAQRHAIECLLNCYLREYALPRGEACLDARGQDLPMSLRQLAGTRVCIDLAGGRLAVAADRTSALGRCRFTSAPYFKGNGQGWRPLGVMELAQLLLAPLASAERHGELMGQIHCNANGYWPLRGARAGVASKFSSPCCRRLSRAAPSNRA